MKRLVALVLSIAAIGALALVAAAPAGAQSTGRCLGLEYAQIHLVDLAPSQASMGLTQVREQATAYGFTIYP